MTPYTRDDYRRAFMALLPSGWAWPREAGSTLVRVVDALVAVYERTGARALDLLRDANPSTTLELLPEWETTLGLPDPCIGPQTSIPARQAQVRARFAAAGGQTPEYMRQVASSLASDVTITEYAPFTADHGCADQPLCEDPSWGHVWRVTINSGTPSTFFRAGQSTDGEALFVPADDGIACVLARIKPAHSILHLTYPS